MVAHISHISGQICIFRLFFSVELGYIYKKFLTNKIRFNGVSQDTQIRCQMISRILDNNFGYVSGDDRAVCALCCQNVVPEHQAFGTRVVDVLTLFINWHTAYERLPTPAIDHTLIDWKRTDLPFYFTLQ